MTPTDRFRACGEALFGSTWQTELARALDLSVEGGIVRKMASGRASIAPHTWRKLAALMRQRGMALQAMVPMADPQDEAAEHIRHLLLDPRPEIVAACLTGMGHTRLGFDLAQADYALAAARNRLAELEMRPLTEDEAAENPFMAALGQTYVDQDAGLAAERDRAAAQSRVNELLREARSIADSLDQGYDGAPC